MDKHDKIQAAMIWFGSGMLVAFLLQQLTGA